MLSCTKYRWQSLYVVIDGKVSEYQLHDGKFRKKLTRQRQRPRKAADLAHAVESGVIGSECIARPPDVVVLSGVPDLQIADPENLCQQSKLMDILNDLNCLREPPIPEAPNFFSQPIPDPDISYDRLSCCCYMDQDSRAPNDMVLNNASALL